MNKIIQKKVDILVKEVPNLVGLLKKEAPNLDWKRQLIRTGVVACETNIGDYTISILMEADLDGDPQNYYLHISNIKEGKGVNLHFSAWTNKRFSELYKIVEKYSKPAK